jgi:type IV fimbrial biogenesis protein FimT
VRETVKRFSAGLTLIELMVAIVVGAVVLAVAVPNLQAFIARSRVSTASTDLVNALYLARGEAIKRGAHVMVGPGATDSNGCWEDLMIFVDSDRDESLDSGEVVLKLLDDFDDVVNICPQNSNDIVFMAVGDAKNNGEVLVTLTGSTDAKYKRRICVGGSGQISVMAYTSACG